MRTACPGATLRPSGCHVLPGSFASPAQDRQVQSGLRVGPVQQSGRARSGHSHVGPDGIAAPFQAPLPDGSGAISETTSSLGTSLGGAENEADALDQPLPTSGLGIKLLTAFSCQLVELGFTPGLSLFPIGRQEPAIFQPVQCRVQRTFRNLNDTAGYLFQPLRDGVSVNRLNRDCLQDQQVEGALREVGL